LITNSILHQKICDPAPAAEKPRAEWQAGWSAQICAEQRRGSKLPCYQHVQGRTRGHPSGCEDGHIH